MFSKKVSYTSDIFTLDFSDDSALQDEFASHESPLSSYNLFGKTDSTSRGILTASRGICPQVSNFCEVPHFHKNVSLYMPQNLQCSTNKKLTDTVGDVGLSDTAGDKVSYTGLSDTADDVGSNNTGECKSTGDFPIGQFHVTRSEFREGCISDRFPSIILSEKMKIAGYMEVSFANEDSTFTPWKKRMVVLLSDQLVVYCTKKHAELPIKVIDICYTQSVSLSGNLWKLGSARGEIVLKSKVEYQLKSSGCKKVRYVPLLRLRTCTSNILTSIRSLLKDKKVFKDKKVLKDKEAFEPRDNWILWYGKLHEAIQAKFRI